MSMANKTIKHYQVEFKLPLTLFDAIESLIPAQREKINEFFVKGKLLSYSLSNEHDRLWAVFAVDNESELVDLVEKLPITPYMDYQYYELVFHQTLGIMPQLSLN